jgi:hypothetical protein
MINPAEIPQIPGDIAAVATQGVTLRTQGRAFAATGSDVDSTWQGLSAVYAAPEAAQLFAATGPVRDRTETVGSQVSTVGDALVTYADEVGPIKAELASLRVQAEAFVRVATATPDWRADPALVAENNRLVTAVDAQVAAWMAAQRECANRIDGLDGGIQYVEDNGDGTRAANEYGYSAALLDQSAAGGGLPWGSPEELDKPWWQDGLDGAGSFLEGFFVDGLVGTVEGLGQLVGFGGKEGLEQSWGGLGRLALALTPVRLLNDVTDLPGLPKGALTEQLDQTARALVAADEWGKDPARAAGAVLFNIVSVIVGTKGVGAGARGGGVVAKGAGKAGLIPRVSIKVADLVTAIKARIPAIRIPDIFRPKIVTTALDQKAVLIDEVRLSGRKITPENVVSIGRDPTGRIVWLEKGGLNPVTKREAGLAHIIKEHGAQFEKAGIPPDQIPDLVQKAVTEGKYTGYYQGRSAPGRPIFEVEYGGRTHYVAVQVGNNGFIIGADLRSSTTPFKGAKINPQAGNPDYRGW